jgi:hypothetical protein
MYFLIQRLVFATLLILIYSNNSYSQASTELKYKIISYHQVLSIDPERIGLMDVILFYQVEGKPVNFVVVPQEGAPEKVIKEYIEDYERRLNWDIGKNNKIISIRDLIFPDPNLTWKRYVMVYYQENGELPQLIVISKEEESPKRIIKAITDNKLAKKKK